MSSVCSDVEEGTKHVCVALAHAGLETSFCLAPLDSGSSIFSVDFIFYVLFEVDKA